VTLAQVLLDDNIGKPDAALETLAGLDDDKRFNSNPDNVARVWQLRITAYNKQGKLEEAVKNLDGLYAKNPDSPAIASGLPMLSSSRTCASVTRARKLVPASDCCSAMSNASGSSTSAQASTTAWPARRWSRATSARWRTCSRSRSASSRSA
jgi:tetratricopeptide (TPR) repeat protein